MSTFTDAYTWKGRDIHGSDGEKIGTVTEIYEDSATGRPEWAVASSGLFGTRAHFVPLAGAERSGERVQVNVTKDQGQLSEEEERRLFEHYGVSYTREGSTTAEDAPAGPTAGGYDTSGPTTDSAMTRSEEELRVGTARQERGRARLRKYVVTEQVQQTVPVQREEVRVTREPITDENIDDALSGPEISEEEHEVVLHEEEPVVEKRTVPKERVRLEKDTVTDEREISEEVSKERIEGPEA
jgi:uncharacterized protein (TIGR02271 family)